MSDVSKSVFQKCESLPNYLQTTTPLTPSPPDPPPPTPTLLIRATHGRVLCTVLVTIPWAGPPSLIEFHSIDN